MKIAVFGATGGTGLQLLKQGLEMGHQLRALVRNPAHPDLLKMFPDEVERAKIDIVVGDALNKEDVEKTIQGQDAVVVTLGGRPGSSSTQQQQQQQTVCSTAQTLINVAVLSSPSVGRLVVVTSMGVGDSYEHLGWLTRFFVNTIIKRPIQDKNLQEDVVRRDFLSASSSSSGGGSGGDGDDKKKDWTIVRPGGLLNSAKTERVLAQEKGIAGGRIARADVAWFLLQHCLTGDQWSRKAVVIVSQ